jgi:2'-5' RNA ligase
VPVTEPFQVGDAMLMFPGDPTGPVGELANCRCTLVYAFEETTLEDQEQPLVAAAEVHTGAMVALIPSEADAERLAVDGGEPVDQLHITLMYLGTAADIPDEAKTQIVSTLQQTAAGWPALEVDGFAVSIFNPPGHSSLADGKDRDSCIVLGISGDRLADVHDVVNEAVRGFADGFALPEQHTPWVPHLTLTYTDDVGRVAELVDRAGPVTFDRIRVAFGGNNVDIPLGSSGGTHPDDDDEVGNMADGVPVSDVQPDVDWDDYFAAAISDFVRSDAQLREHWVRGEGAAKIRWPEPGSFGRCVRQLRKYVRDPEGLCAEYHHEATGKWPGEKRGESADISTDLADAAAPMDEPMAEPGMPMQSEPDDMVDYLPGEHWHAIMHQEGVSTGLRTFTPGGLTWREPPFAFHWQYQSSAHGGLPATVQVGNVTRVERRGDAIHGWGTLDLGSPEGLEYARKLVSGFSRWVSIGLDESFKESDVVYVWPAGVDLDVVDMIETEPEEMIINAGRIGELTAVSVPAQQEATVEPSPELAAMFEVEEEPMTAAAVGTHKTGTTDEPWDAGAVVKRLPSPMPVDTARAVFAWIDESRIEDGMIPKDAAKFPHHQVSADGRPGAANLKACSQVIAALHGARGNMPDIPAKDRQGVYNHVAAHMRAAKMEPPEMADHGPSVVVAAGHTITIPDVPPAEWFTEPTDVTPEGALTITDDGRLYGYLAPAGIAHRSFRDRRVEVPMGQVDYTRWMGGEALVAGGGRVVAGPITMECGHMPPGASADSAVRMEHYDNTCSVVAKAAVGENRHGVWIAGALEPGVTAEQVSRMLACRLSGDWAPHPEKPGWREFVAALLVPVPGFAMGRSAPSVRVKEGVLVASAVPVRMAAMMSPGGMGMFAVGDRVQVVGQPHEPGQTTGTVAMVSMGPAYGVVFDGGGEDEPGERAGEVHRWYVGAELAAAEAGMPAEMPEPMAASAGPDLRPVLEHIARRLGRDTHTRMESLRSRVHAGD